MKRHAGRNAAAFTVFCALLAAPAHAAEDAAALPVPLRQAEHSPKITDSLRRELAEITAQPLGQDLAVEIKVRLRIAPAADPDGARVVYLVA
jgi:hypothetical protein